MAPIFPIHRTGLFRALLAVTLCTATLRAGNLLVAAPSTISVTCNTATGPGTAATVVVKPVATLTSGTIAVAAGPVSSGLVVTPPSPATLSASNQAQGLTFSVNLGAGCAGASTGTTSFKFYIGNAADAQVTVNTTVTAAVSALVAVPVTLTCTRSAGPPVVYTPGASQTVTVTSAAAGGTPFTVDPSANPTWLAVTPLTGGTANATGVPFTAAAVAPCGNYPAGSTNSASIHLRNQPAPDSLVAVTLQILGPSPLTANPKAPVLSYTKGSGTAASVDVALSAGGSQSTAFSVDSASLPGWLTVDALSGGTPKTLHFSTTSVVEAIASGTYAASVRVKVSGFADLLLPFGLALSDPPPKLTVAEGTSRDLSWAVGQPAPIAYITVASTGSAIPYTITTGGGAGPTVSASLLKGFAYSSGTPIPVIFDPAALAAAPPGTVTGTVTFTWGNPAATLVVTFNVTVQPPPATVVSIAPSSLPTSAAGQKFTVALSGTGFVASSDPSQQTFVGIVSGGSIVADANLAASVINPSNMIVIVTVPKADQYLPFPVTGTGGAVILGVCNPMGATCSAPTGTIHLTIGVNPVIQSVTSASAFLQVTPPALPAVAPYDILSIFGTSFCSSGGTGCDTSQTLYGILDPASERYPSSLSPDPAGRTQRFLTVTFQTHAPAPVVIDKAPLLFATNSQINLLAPSGVAAYLGKSVDIVVSFGYGPAATMLSSAPFTVNVVAADPGIFTVGGEGQGDGAILAMDWSVVTTGNEAAMRSTAADSDTVQMYVTGLGAPDGTADNATAGAAGLWPADCISIASYLSTLNLTTSASSATVDGARIASSLLSINRLPPCMRSTAAVPTVTIGGQPATVTYAGWVPDSLAGLYQVNVRLPGSSAGTFTDATGAALAPPLTVPVKLPVVITARNISSQPGVTIAVAPRLKLVAPGVLTGKAGTAWASSGNLVTASEGTPAYHYAVTSGTLPAGLALDSASGAISGTPAAAAKGSYVLTVTAADSASNPLTGTVTFTLGVQ